MRKAEFYALPPLTVVADRATQIGDKLTGSGKLHTFIQRSATVRRDPPRFAGDTADERVGCHGLVNARGLGGNTGLAFAPLLSSTPLVGHAMFAVVRVGFRIAKNPCFLDALAFWIQFA